MDVSKYYVLESIFLSYNSAWSYLEILFVEFEKEVLSWIGDEIFRGHISHDRVAILNLMIRKNKLTFFQLTKWQARIATGLGLLLFSF